MSRIKIKWSNFSLSNVGNTTNLNLVASILVEVLVMYFSLV